MSTPLRVLIVDDETHARVNLRLALQALPGWQVAGECASASAARAFLAEASADIVLLDVQMPVETGLDLARELSCRDQPPLVIFVTAHRGHALDAFDVHALDYLVKPVNEERLRQALERAGALLRQRAAYTAALRQFVAPEPGYWREVTVRSVGRMDRVALADVRWIETAGNYVELHLAERTFLHRSTLAELERYLDPAEFLRIHRRILVRRALIKRLRQVADGGCVMTLADGTELPVSERYVAAAKAAL
ncbi:LytR/AlgR family response regulator transcription factor [Pseudoduganella armeniaca]|uniref:DNA-binding response regulator n=1 Tax=Pseudoduganella armeniaca TaxID=2072590 RepID=A0A2R4CFI6_9BURK|nr:LytTR family DNA-binding domain-containing protein [Pseudoduganella armeniaca]AVR98365.1 DNA-binding response regulator [Pseudoduganella armeniaca]